MLLASFAFRAMGLLQAVIDTDEGLYLVQAQAWLRGEWPLISVWDMHPVGAPAMIALSLLAFGESVGAVRLLGILCVAATGWALFGLVRAAGGGRGLGIGAGLLYIAETTQLRGLATNTEILFAPFIAAAMAVAMGAAARTLGATAAARRAGGSCCAAGLLVGAALAIKQVVALEGCLVFALLAFPGAVAGVVAGAAASSAWPPPMPCCARCRRRSSPWPTGCAAACEVFLDSPLRRAVPLFAGAARTVGSAATHLHRSRHPALAGAAGRHRVANWCRRRFRRRPASEMRRRKCCWRASGCCGSSRERLRSPGRGTSTRTIS